MDLLQTPSSWTTQPSQPEQQDTPHPVTGAYYPSEQPQPADVPKPALLATAGLTLVLCLGLLWFAALRQTNAPPQVVAPGPTQLTVAGLHGPVTLVDWQDGRTWLSWWKRNRDWAGTPIWADRPYQESASCAAFVRAIVCVNFDAKVRGTVWQLTPALLGRTAMLKAGLLPDSTSQPAAIVAAYMAHLRAMGVDVWYRFGAIQSPMLVVGSTAVQYYQRARLEWPVSSQQPAEIRLAPLGQQALENGW